MTYTVVMRNSMGGELDRKTCADLGDILHEYANEGCLSGGDTLTIIDNDENQDMDDDEPNDRCTSPDGLHDWPLVEEHERCLCTWCGADGDA